MNTDFDFLVNGKGINSKDEKEKKPWFFSRIHGVPKQIADTSQSIGVNEKTLKNGLMSGVILPSQIAHDRWLSIYDGIFDAFVMFIVFFVMSLYPISLETLIVYSIMTIYMFFHILWWEHAVQWSFIETISNYIEQTRRYYYYTYSIAYLFFSTIGLYVAYQIDLSNMIIRIVDYYHKALEIVEKINSKTNLLNKKEESYISEFSNEATYSKVNEITTKNEFIIDNVSPSYNFDIENLSSFILLNLIGVVLILLIYKYSNKHYSKIKDKNLDGVDLELKSDLELKMTILKDNV